MAKKYEFHKEFSLYPVSAIQALNLGEMYYYTGKPCGKNHLSPRYASSGNCVQCIADSRGKVEINIRGKSSIRNQQDQKLAENAHSNGFTTYHSITKCPKGHYERFVTTNNCAECSKNSCAKRSKASKWSRIKKEYGITEEDFNKLINLQNNKCSICKGELNNKNTHIDHCHKTGKVRSLLCNKCNQAIGLFNENLEKIESAINYLRIHNGIT